MTEIAGDPPPPASTPMKTQTWVIIVAVVVFLCCLCIGMTGLLLAFGPELLNELHLLGFIAL